MNYIYVDKGYGGNSSKWRIEAVDHRGTVYDADGPFDSKEDAIAAVPNYVCLFDFAGNWTLSVND